MAKIIGLKDLRMNTSKYIGLARKGKSFLVMQRSKPAFTITPPVDEWGDEGVWESILDVEKINGKPMPVSDLIKAFKRAHAADR